MSAATPNSQSASYKLVGVRIASLAEQQSAQERIKQALQSAIANGGVRLNRLAQLTIPVVPVFENSAGEKFLGVPTAFGPAMTSFAGARSVNPHNVSAGEGGYLSTSDLLALGSAPGAEDVTAHIPALVQAAYNSMGSPTVDGDPSAVNSFLQSTLMEAAQEVVGQGLASMASGSQLGATFDNIVAAGSAPGALGGLAESLAGAAIGNLMNAGLQAAMSGWKVDDESSTAEHAAKQATESLIGRLQSELGNATNGGLGNLAGRITEFFAGPISTASVPVGNIGSADSADGLAVMGASTVLVNQRPATRQGDGVTMVKPSPDIGPLQSGNPFVLTQALPTAGTGHLAIGLSKGIPALLTTCSPDVFMGLGTAGTAISPPSPPETKSTSNSAPSASFVSSSSGSSNPFGVLDILGYIWNLPNTIIGSAIGLTGHVLGEMRNMLGLGPDPGISFGHNGIEFTDNPFIPAGAGMTIGNIIMYGSANGPSEIGGHEEQHTYQGAFLGPLYLPTYGIAVLTAVLSGKNWHDNFMEDGLDDNPPQLFKF